MRPLALLFVALALPVQQAHPQLDSSHSSTAVQSLGILLGYANTYVDQRIGAHMAYSVSGELSIVENVILKIQLGYFQSNKSTPWAELEYKGTSYSALRPQLWNDLGLGIGLLHRVSSFSKVGFVVGADWIKVRRISYRDPVFWVDYFTDTPYIIESSIVDETEKLIRPSAALIAESEWEFDSRFSLQTELSYKLSFVGNKYGYGALNTENTYGISAGIIYRFH